LSKALNKNTVITIGGPTASGKSGFALVIAQKMNGVIINFDSMQLYNGLHILTAHPTKEDLEKAEHKLYSVLSPEEKLFSAAQWRELAIQEINNVIANNKLPILVGGTGFYQKALIDGLSPIPPTTQQTREMLKQKHTELGGTEFFNQFALADPITSKSIDSHNTQRIMRAWEVLIDTGKPLHEWHKVPPVTTGEKFDFFNINILPDRDILYKNCDLRFEIMLEQGALKEVENFKNKYSNMDIPLNNALGYKELCDYIDGNISLGAAKTASQQSTRNYAKRQVTWFKNQVKTAATVINPKAEIDNIILQLSK